MLLSGGDYIAWIRWRQWGERRAQGWGVLHRRPVRLRTLQLMVCGGRPQYGAIVAQVSPGATPAAVLNSACDWD